LFWLAGTRYWLDLKSKDPREQREFKERGAELIELAMRKPDAPADLATTAATIRTKLGQSERALKDLKEMVMTVDDPAAQRKLLQRVGDIADADLMRELRAARAVFDRAHIRHARDLPADMFVLLGPPP